MDCGACPNADVPLLLISDQEFSLMRRYAFKFMNSQFVPDFLDHGRVRIGTAEEYRVPDGLTGARSDEHEMSMTWRPGQEINMARDDPRLEHMADNWGVNVAGWKIGEGGAISFVLDAYMFCMSWKLDKQIFAKMARSFKADACVAILDVDRFTDAVTAASDNLDSEDRTHGRVIYNALPVTPFYNPTRPHPLQKRHVYAWQNEYRALWGSGGKDAKPFLVDVPGIRDILDPVAPSCWRKYHRLLPIEP